MAGDVRKVSDELHVLWPDAAGLRSILVLVSSLATNSATICASQMLICFAKQRTQLCRTCSVQASRKAGPVTWVRFASATSIAALLGAFGPELIALKAANSLLLSCPLISSNRSAVPGVVG